MVDPAVAAVIGATITAVPAGLAAYASIVVARRTKTNHGMNIGQHVEQAALDAKEAKLEAQAVRIELGEYMLKQDRVNTTNKAFRAAVLRRLPSVDSTDE